MSRAAALAVVALAVCCAPLAGQRAGALVPGSRVRVWSDELEEYPVLATFRNLDERWLSLLEPGVGPRLIAVAAIDRLEVSHGKNPLVFWSAIGLGAGVGALVGSAVPEKDRCRLGIARESECRHETSDILIGAAAGGIAAALLAGKWVKERWAPVPLARIVVRVKSLVNRRVSMGLALRF